MEPLNYSERLDYLYEDSRHDLINKYRRQNEESIRRKFKLNIVNFNDYITDEIIGEEGFKHPLEAFYYILIICVAMADLKLMDEYFFEDINEYIIKYHNGEYDKYFFNIKEDKKEIDKDIETVLNYYKQYKNAH